MAACRSFAFGRSSSSIRRPRSTISVPVNSSRHVFSSRSAAKAAVDSWNLLRRHLTAEFRRERVRELRAKGMSTRQIAGELKVSQMTVVRDLKQSGESSVSPAPPPPPPTFANQLIAGFTELGDDMERGARPEPHRAEPSPRTPTRRDHFRGVPKMVPRQAHSPPRVGFRVHTPAANFAIYATPSKRAAQVPGRSVPTPNPGRFLAFLAAPKKGRRRAPGNDLAAGRRQPKGEYSEFSESVKKAEADAVARNVALVQRAAAGGGRRVVLGPD